MELVIDTGKPTALNWAAKGAERIAQNVLSLLSTWRYEVAYDRTMGLHPGILDMPADKASALFIAEAHRIIPFYEPRAIIKEIQFLGVDDDGQMQHRVVIEI